MSSCLIIQNGNKTYMGSDTALSTPINNKFVRINKQTQKIYQFNNGLIFCSGNMIYVDKTIEFINSIENINPYKISEFLKSNIKIKQSDIFQIEIACILISEKNPIMYQISEYNNFEIIEHIPYSKNIKIFACGLNTNECLNISEKEYNKNISVEDIFINTFNKLACEQIGGKLTVWEIGSSIKKLFSSKIEDEFIKRRNIKFSIHSLIADTIVGRIVASNELVVTNSANNFTVNASGATLTNATLNINSTSGNSRIFLDPVNGIKIQANVGGTWTDKFFVDNGGNLTFTGNLTGATGTFSGAINAATITGGTITGTAINGGSISGTTGTFSGNIYAANLQGYINAPQIGSVYGSSMTPYGTISNNNLHFDGGRLYQSGNALYLLGNSIVSVKSANGTSEVILGNSAALFGYNSISLSSNGSVNVDATGLNLGGAAVATQIWVSGRGYLTQNTSYRNAQYTVFENPGRSTWSFDYGRVKSITYSA